MTREHATTTRRQREGAHRRDIEDALRAARTHLGTRASRYTARQLVRDLQLPVTPHALGKRLANAHDIRTITRRGHARAFVHENWYESLIGTRATTKENATGAA